MNQTLRQVPELSLMSYIEGSTADQVKFVDNLINLLPVAYKTINFVLQANPRSSHIIVSLSYSLLQLNYQYR